MRPQGLDIAPKSRLSSFLGVITMVYVDWRSRASTELEQAYVHWPLSTPASVPWAVQCLLFLSCFLVFLVSVSFSPLSSSFLFRVFLFPLPLPSSFSYSKLKSSTARGKTKIGAQGKPCVMDLNGQQNTTEEEGATLAWSPRAS